MKNKTLVYLLLSALVLPVSCNSVMETPEPRKPKNIIILIGDGMGVSQISAARIVNGGPLNMERCLVYGFAETHSASDYVTDSGAGGTAISTGTRTYNGAIAVSIDSLPLKTILEYAEDKGLATGLISTSGITHATPASFIAHQKNRNFYEAIAADFVKTDVDLVIGGGSNHFAKRKDSVNLLDELKDNGYQVFTDMEDFDLNGTSKAYIFTAEGHNPRYSEGRGEMLPKATNLAAAMLSKNSTGFFMMVEGSMIDWGGHDHNVDYIIEETLDFDRAVGEALNFAEKDGNTLVIVTSDHETGGLGLNGGDMTTHQVIGGFTTSGHTAALVPVFAYGPGADEFNGIQKNTDLFVKMMKLLGLNDESEEK